MIFSTSMAILKNDEKSGNGDAINLIMLKGRYGINDIIESIFINPKALPLFSKKK